ncbi:uncharacterized protein LOC124420803 [Lucilia cuprina]|uniref:uncharacterized protein LOC124420803 n=1 Tax=Lucilia cuprina TaxID=7375 RepID=UPI001F07002D|nr:uncharacterized protein LOC124420803 [Lucilia cuprina]
MLFKQLYFIAFNLVAFASGIQIYQYRTPLVSLKQGNGWIIDGHFKLIHVIDLQKYIEMTADISSTVQKHIPPSRNKEFILHHMLQIQERLSELTNEKRRTCKSIDWIGSAWKWVAGNPDATDWNTILKSQESIIANNNEQYKINKELHQTMNQAVEKINELIVRLNNITSGKDLAFVEQSTINEIIILKDEINEIVRACQMAKSGIINTNLLDQAEINRIIDELETLPYSNAIEAVEHGMPSVYTNGSLLLYILSIPKLGENVYNLLLTRATINEGRQIDLQFNKILINAAEIYGIIDNCLSINNSTVCKGSSVTRLKEDDCLNRILRGGAAKCRYRLTLEEIFEVLDEDVTNFKGLYFEKPFNLTTDASNTALGAVLSQGEIGKDRPIAYISRSLNKTEENYATNEKEMLAIVWALDNLRNYFYASEGMDVGSDDTLTASEGRDDDELSSGATVHSAERDASDLIPHVEVPINVFKNQIIIKIGIDMLAVEEPHREYTRHFISSKEWSEEALIAILKEKLRPNIINGIKIPESLLGIMQEIYIDHFSRYKIRITQKLVTDITSKERQFEIIEAEHRRAIPSQFQRK